MKNFRTLSLCALALGLTGCWTSIWTSAPTTETVVPVNTVYTTQVSGPSYPTTTTTVTVTSYNNDLSYYLDLQAVGAAFAESRSAEEFERILNSSRYMINNIDLNHDGYVDYLRVIETRQGYYHTFLIQACLAPHMFQDVATLVAERRTDRLYVEIIGDHYLYGYNYVVRPVFIQRPPMWDVFGRPHYNPWSSPYYHGHWPNHYTQPRPVYLNHYQAYVNTYMHNHQYCHRCDYPQQPYWNGYTQMTQPHRRNDYANQHPNDAFDKRIGQTTVNGSGVTIRNAGQLREHVSRNQQNAQTTTQQGRTGQTQSTTRTAQTTTTVRNPQSVSTTRQPAVQQNQSVSGRNSQSAATTTGNRSSQTTTTTTTNRSSQTTTTTTSTNRSSQTTATSGRSSQTTTQSQSSANRQPSTSVSTRVNRSGEVKDTRIQTTDASGRTTTTTRSSGTTSSGRSSSTGTSTSTSSGRSSGSSSSSSSSSTSGRSGSNSGSSSTNRR